MQKENVPGEAFPKSIVLIPMDFSENRLLFLFHIEELQTCWKTTIFHMHHKVMLEEDECSSMN